ncbi:MipA/OmpV family protein [Mangrovicella endophytica]|uniref:MipA/OmpV family protein n=1 Tax=Mangrovicella endophytica TaxID=2066697 RepID=UPI001FE1C20C|nr:MipA/OmpV family protein [Mangrovicella endophytica]
MIISLHRLAASVLLLASLGLGSAQAADVVDEAPAMTPDERIDLVFEIGAGAEVAPAYEGSDEYIVSPFPIISVDYLNIPGLFSFGGGPRGGFSIGPSFRFIDERNEDEYDELEGLDSIDATYEVGLKASYEWDYAEVYGEARYAFGGADGFVGGLGANIIARPTEALELKAGPRATFASSDYMDTYFSVSAAEAAVSNFDEYEAEGGFKTVGVAASARYEVYTDWFVNANAAYERLIGDAADSPIVEVGSKDQFFVGLGLSRRFSVDLF